MQSIMQGLSTASKPPKPEPQVLEITSLLTGIRELVAYDARRASIDVTVEVDDPVLTVCGDRSHVTQILLNLVTNAIEAMSERGGRVVLRARRAGGAAAAMLEVADTGPGIPPDRLGRVLYDEGGRHGPGPGDRALPRRGERWEHQRRQRDRPGNRLHHCPARPERARGCHGADDARRSLTRVPDLQMWRSGLGSR
jgi:hypothetical protein